MLPTPRAVMSVVRLSDKKYFENKDLHNLPTLYKLKERTMQRTYVHVSQPSIRISDRDLDPTSHTRKSFKPFNFRGIKLVIKQNTSFEEKCHGGPKIVSRKI